MSWRKTILLLAAGLLFLLVPLSQASAKEKSIYDVLEKKSNDENNESVQINEPEETSVLPYALKFIFSFLLIIALLYFVLRYLSKKTNQFNQGGPFHGIGGHSLGNNRSVQLLMVGDTLYILGVGESINLLRMVPPGEEQKRLLEMVAEKQGDPIADWGAKLKKTSQEKWNELLLKQLKDGKPNSGKGNGEK
ncbi:flagellar biosynthetic protein FliO [Neobacillus piezotolerans]|uniref:flagellar biosynthetic protein FliO n=1 Tax=Neobacillus piezotolerans TaxID=2259171 RepID=UPI0015F15A39|nr:flagellar biosynthetic protein FliO [Neobacillus piezotolerans]